MPNSDEDLWSNLTGGYRTPFDPRPLLAELEIGQDPHTTWDKLWEELHHQGDVGDASYAAVIGVSDAGFRTTPLPAISAIATSPNGIDQG